MDVLVFAIPAPEQIPELVPMTPRKTVWGDADEDWYIWNGEYIGRLLEMRLEPWLVERLPPRFQRDLGGWHMFHVAAEAYLRWEDALRAREGGLDLTPILLRVLASQSDWLALCIRDFDQNPLEFAAMSPEDVVSRLRKLVVRDDGASDFVAWRP